MNTYLSCKVRKGQFGGEWAVQGTTHSGSEFSLFVPDKYVDQDEECEADAGWIRVHVLKTDGTKALVRLPGQTFENGQTVAVLLGQIKERAPKAFA